MNLLTLNLKRIILLCFFFVLPANAEIKNCSGESREIGVEFNETNKNISVLSTAEVTYNFNDSGSILDALDEAKDEAILNIVEFLQINIKDIPKKNEKKILKDNSKTKILPESFSLKPNNIITSESILKGIKLIDYCKFEKLKKIQATVEITTKSTKEASKLKSILNFKKN